VQHRIDRDAPVLQCPLVTPQAAGRSGVVLEAAEQEDAAVPGRQQETGDRVGAALVVVGHYRDRQAGRGCGPPDEDQPGAGGVEGVRDLRHPADVFLSGH
jgi:hypothetical protein